MANTFLTPEVVAKEALMVLTSNLVMADLVHRDYAEELVSVGDTVSIRKPAKFVAKNFTGTAEAQDITEGSVSVKLDRFRDVTVAVTSKQMSLDIEDFSQQVVEPAMQAIAQAIDQDILAVAVSKAGMTQPGTKDAADLGIANGEIVEVSSRRGTITAEARVSDKTNPGQVWMPFHYVDGANWLTIDALDSISSTPEYKVCAVKVSKICSACC